MRRTRSFAGQAITNVILIIDTHAPPARPAASPLPAAAPLLVPQPQPQQRQLPLHPPAPWRLRRAELPCGRTRQRRPGAPAAATQAPRAAARTARGEGGDWVNIAQLLPRDECRSLLRKRAGATAAARGGRVLLKVAKGLSQWLRARPLSVFAPAATQMHCAAAEGRQGTAKGCTGAL